jgi:hypothetical protein
MSTYLVAGTRQVAGKAPGATVKEHELAGCNIAALIRGGHLAPIPTKAVKADNSEEQ